MAVNLEGLSQIWLNFGHLPAGEVVKRLAESNVWQSPGGVQTTQDLVKNGPLMVDDSVVKETPIGFNSFNPSDNLSSSIFGLPLPPLPPPEESQRGPDTGGIFESIQDAIIGLFNWFFNMVYGVLRNLGFSVLEPLILPLLIIAFIVFFWRA